MSPPPQPDDRWLLIKAGLLIDGTGQPARRRVAVLVHGSKISGVGPLGSVTAPAGATVTEIDALDGTVIPGLIDCHLHVTYAGHLGMAELEWPNSLEYSAINAGATAALALRCGYTSALDVGCRGRIGVAAREAVTRGVVPGPHLRVSGQIVSTVGGPLDSWPANMRVDPATRLTVLVSGVDDIRRVVREQAKDGVDNVKLQISWSTVQSARRGRATTFTREELRAATEAAHDLGLSIAAHAEGPEVIAEAIEAGFDTIQHASFIDERTIALLDRHPNCRLVFTLGVYDDIRLIGPRIGYPPAGGAAVEAGWPAMVSAVKLAHERGVAFAVGSDCGGKVHPQGRYAHDVTLLVRAVGLSVEHAIRAATAHAAEAAWFPDTGRVAAGLDADLAVVKGDLAERIEVLEDESAITTVVRKGQIVKGR